MSLKLKMKFEKPFKDGHLWQRLADAGFAMDHENPTQVRAGSEAVVSEELYGMVVQCGGEVTAVLVDDQPPVNASPMALALAEKWGIDLHGIEGSGKDGQLLKADVQVLVDQLEDDE